MRRRERLYAIMLGLIVLLTAGVVGSAVMGEAPAPPEPEQPAEAEPTVQLAVSGQVLDPTGHPVAGATVRLGERSGRADPEGQFTFSDVTPGTLVIDASAPGLMSPGPDDLRGLRLTVAEGKPVEGLRLVLRKPGQILGRVVAAGQPVPGAEIGLQYKACVGIAGELGPFPLPGLGKTDAEGRFRLDGVAPGRLRVEARSEGLGPGQSREIRLADGEVRDEVIIDLRPAATLTGTVRSRTGAALLANLELNCATLPAPKTLRTQADGRFRWDGVPAGTCTLTARAALHFPQTVELTLGPGHPSQQDLELEPAHGLVGRVIDPQGAAVPMAQVVVTPRGGAEQVVQADPDGRFAWAADPAEIQGASLVAVSPAHAPSAPVVAQAGEEVTLRVGAGGTISGRVVDGEGKPIPSYFLAIEHMAPEGPATVPGRYVPPQRVARSDGAFSLGPLRPGRYDLRAETEGRAPGHARAVVVVSGQETSGVTVVLSAGATVRGVVTSRADGRPIAGAQIAIFEPMSVLAPRSTVTDASGAWVLTGVGAGRRSLRVHHPDYLAELVSGLDVPESGETRRDVQLEKAKPGERFSFQGIGATLSKTPHGVVIQGLMAGTPAEAAGLRAGDRILAVDREAVSGLHLSQVVERIRGEAGMPVVLEVEREGGGRFTVQVSRGRVVVKE